jgi:hypothetical protein
MFPDIFQSVSRYRKTWLLPDVSEADPKNLGVNSVGPSSKVRATSLILVRLWVMLLTNIPVQSQKNPRQPLPRKP